MRKMGKTNEKLEAEQKNHTGNYVDSYSMYEPVVCHGKQHADKDDAGVGA